MGTKKRFKLEQFNHRVGTVTISNLTEKMVEKVLKMLEGTVWLRGNKSRTNFEEVQVYSPLPNPTEDKELAPFWQKYEQRLGQGIQLDLFYNPVDRALFPRKCPSLYLRGLCANSYRTRQYQQEVRYLKHFGFIQLRSQRRDDGKFIELWYLEDITSLAEGRFAIALNNTNSDAVTAEVLRLIEDYLSYYVAFESLEITYIRSHLSK